MDRLNGQMEWEITGSQGNLPDDRVQCLYPGMGGSVQRPEDQRSVVKLGMPNAYQLPGAPGNHIGCPEVHETQMRDSNPRDAGQHNGGVIHQCHGQDNIASTDEPSQISLAAVPGLSIQVYKPTLYGYRHWVHVV